MSFRRLRVNKFLVIAILSIALVFLSSCSPKKSEKEPPKNDQNTQTGEKDDLIVHGVELGNIKLMRYENPLMENAPYIEAAVNRGYIHFFTYYLTDSFASSDNNYFPIVAEDPDNGIKLFLVSKDLRSVFTVDSINKDLAQQGYLFYILGWKDDTLYYMKAEGEEKEKGFSFYSFNTQNKNSKKLAFLNLENLYVGNFKFVPEKNRVILFVPGKFLQIELDNGNISLLKSGLPSYDGLFYSRISPDGRFIAYSYLEPERRGIYVFDVENKKEQRVAISKDADYFMPQWSYDGRYLAFYFLKKNEKGELEFVEGEDGPYPIGDGIKVVDLKENEQFDVTLEDEKGKKRIGYFYFNKDSNFLLFTGISLENAGKLREFSIKFDMENMINIPFEGLWFFDLNEKTSKKISGEKRLGFYPSAVISKNEYYYFDSYDHGWQELRYFKNGSEKEVFGKDYSFMSGRYYTLPLIKDKLILAGNKDYEMSVFEVYKGKARQIFKAKGILRDYYVADGNIIIFMNTLEDQEKLIVIPLN